MGKESEITEKGGEGGFLNGSGGRNGPLEKGGKGWVFKWL